MQGRFCLLGVVGAALLSVCAVGQSNAPREADAGWAGESRSAETQYAEGDGEVGTVASPDFEALGYQPPQERKLSRRSEPDRIAPRPFSSLGVGLTLGTEGAGLQLATPLTAKWNLRVGASGLTFNPNIFEDGFAVVGDIRLLNAFAGVDYHPFFYKWHRLRVSPGVTFYNGSRLRALATVPGGQTFDLGYGTFTSDPNDPVKGNFNLDFGRRVAPRLTFGVGNLSPRRGQRWSFPFEVGFEYIGQKPKISLDLSGSTCDQTSCSPVLGDPQAQSDLAQEQVNLNRDIPGVLRLLPIVTIGVSYRFGH